MRKIASNDDLQKFTHKEVRAYARCLLVVIGIMDINYHVSAEIEVLLTGLSAPKLPHYDRAFLARCILKLLEDSKIEDMDDCF